MGAARASTEGVGWVHGAAGAKPELATLSGLQLPPISSLQVFNASALCIILLSVIESGTLAFWYHLVVLILYRTFAIELSFQDIF